MQFVSYQPIAIDYKRLVGSITIGATAAFALFIVMAKLIENDQIVQHVAPLTPIGPVILDIEEPDVIKKQPLPPKQEVIKAPETPKMEPQTPDIDDGLISLNNIGNQIGPIDIGKNISLGNTDQSARPVVQIEPNYPVDAARDGIEGWVELSFTIAPNGTTQDITVMNAEPARIFNRAARRALSKWRYQPKLVDGRAVSQPGMRVLLSFTLAQ